MSTPTVTEIIRALEPVGRDTFIDGPDAPATLAGRRSRYAPSSLRVAVVTQDRARLTQRATLAA